MMQIVIICDVQAASNGGAKTGTMTVSSPGLGQVALQIQQQVRGPGGGGEVSQPERCLITNFKRF